MEAQDKAKRLVDSFFTGKLLYDEINWHQAKQCALICCDEIIEQWQEVHGNTAEARLQIIEKLKYWREVKSEIEKL